MCCPGTCVEKLSKTTKTLVGQVLKQGFDSETPRIQRRNLDPQIIIWSLLLRSQRQQNGSVIAFALIKHSVSHEGSFRRNIVYQYWKVINWVNNKEFCVLHVQSNTTIFYLLVQ